MPDPDRKWQQEESASTTTSSLLLTHILPISSVWLRCPLSTCRGCRQPYRDTHTTPPPREHRNTLLVSFIHSFSQRCSGTSLKNPVRLQSLFPSCCGYVWFAGISHWFPVEHLDGPFNMTGELTCFLCSYLRRTQTLFMLLI